MEIERKFTIKQLPENLSDYVSRQIIQGYLCTNPVMRIRKDNEEYYFTYKGKGMLAREEYNLPLTKDGFEHLLKKVDGRTIEKTRYEIPLESPTFQEGFTPAKDLKLIIELDVFSSPSDLIMAEVEFPDVQTADAFIAPDWFLKDVTDNPSYHNSNMI